MKWPSNTWMPEPNLEPPDEAPEQEWEVTVRDKFGKVLVVIPATSEDEADLAGEAYIDDLVYESVWLNPPPDPDDWEYDDDDPRRR